jgi:hypothetical protein
MKNKAQLLKIVERIKLLSKKLKKPPQSVTLKNLSDSGIPERRVRSVGGLGLIRNKYFPVTDKDLVVIEELKQDKSYVTKLEKSLAKSRLEDQQILEILQGISIKIKVPRANLSDKKGNIKREVVAMLNDTHYGLFVDPEEVNDTNKYDWQVACRRTAMFTKQIGDYKVEKRHEVDKLHLVLNGDHLQGLIHDKMGKTQDLLGLQQNGTIHILAHMIGYLSQKYKEVIVYCTHGNHDDNVIRREGRIISHKAKDSFLTAVYFGVSLGFKDVQNVNFVMSKGLHVDIPLPAGRAVATHGDTLFSGQLGNPGTSLNVKSLSDAINRWNTGETDKGREKAKLFLFGHTHVYSEFKTFDGVRVLIAPSLSGVDNFAHSLSINHNQIGQAIFESTAKHIYGDSRMINLVEADNDKSLDEIIPTYKGELSFK